MRCSQSDVLANYHMNAMMDPVFRELQNAGKIYSGGTEIRNDALSCLDRYEKRLQNQTDLKQVQSLKHSLERFSSSKMFNAWMDWMACRDDLL